MTANASSSAGVPEGTVRTLAMNVTRTVWLGDVAGSGGSIAIMGRAFLSLTCNSRIVGAIDKTCLGADPAKFR